MKKSTLQEEVISLIYRVAKLMYKQMEPAGDGDELSSAQLQALFTLAKGACNAGSLAKELNVTLPTVTALTDRLVGHDWVERQVDPDDRRSVRLELTEQGKVMLKRAKQARYRRLSHLLDAMPEEDVETLHRIFGDLYQRLEQETSKERRA